MRQRIGIPVAVVALIACGAEAGADEHQPENHLCDHDYALCTSAPCVPLPDDPTRAICWCDVEEGKSLATVPCDRIEPRTDDHGIRTVYSTFSLVQFEAGEKGMKCPSGTPWTWCLNMPCTVDPADPERAICVCTVKRSEEWMTLGGDCDTGTCAGAYWSGATIADSEDGAEFLTKELHLPENPATWCQTTE